MAKQGTILVVDDNKGILTAVQMLLGTCFEKVITISTPNKIKSTLHDDPIDVVLLDMNFSSGINNGNEGLFWLSEIKKEYPSVQVVLFTAYADIDLAVRGIKDGATDFIVKPWDNAKLIETLQTAYNLRSSNQKKTNDKQLISKESGMFWGESNAMQQLRILIDKVAKTDANILITGENGTGKEMLAREIHLLSNRKNEAMVPVDMGAITETLFESELFGHVKGAFTDARTDRSGKFEVANNSTLFLDEIGNLSFHLQAKLLTALQRRSIIRVGSNTPIPVNIRLICATNKDLQEMVQKEEFREDLLYRINTIHVEIPPLRERLEDIIPLTEIFLSKYGNLYSKPTLHLSNDAQEKLKQQPWFGNIRELEHTIEKAVIICEGDTLDSNDFDFPRKKETQTKEITTLEEMEYNMIKNAMDKFGGNLSLVANQLGISRQTLYNKIKRYEI
ncbi:sigma-54-dependent transcriptional regulator [Parabacteroides chinchillae]|uniref:DNA-binding transcriptional response regulator, NtrC family, contains REC, AAA-type ATPase, and a Fis-type DNA-binding domains n=1 Tax=Parabacteroides chinchillae TaxID=871327 RepID=A0A8G2BTF1_9BACT|nr:sigma-54 dependent transcriptional regulator [Parabacteroides chinchillae]SEF39906.1 DNA-binding transcriptional response regulator, NtrC family, contains REC, AAA-type ATPase, and a Fis-type DNA-binding domains [Parabacteroides chinchillae]